LPQRFLALRKRKLAQIFAVEFEQIEQVIAHAGFAFGDRVLERAKMRAAFGVHHHDLAVDERAFAVEFLKRRDQLRETAGPIVAIARINPRLIACECGNGTIAVELDFMEPIAARGRRIDERRKLRRDEGR
jgi:hypothetical protein